MHQSLRGGIVGAVIYYYFADASTICDASMHDSGPCPAVCNPHVSALDPHSADIGRLRRHRPAALHMIPHSELRTPRSEDILAQLGNLSHSPPPPSTLARIACLYYTVYS